MKKFLFFFLSFSVFSLPLPAQPEYEKADARAAEFTKSYTDHADLARQLTEPFSTEKEKARAIFSWIAQNVRYDCKKFKNPEKVRFNGSSKEDVQRQRQEWEADQLRQTLRKKKGVCEDYSRLFKAMCDAVGLEAVVIDGTGRSFYNPFRKLPKNTNHAWNAVKIDGQWGLLDATWAAGYVDESVTKFTSDFQPGYFLTRPEWFAQDHFPADEKWQLLDTPVAREAFPEQPILHFGQIKYPVEDFLPKNTPQVVDGKMEIRIKFTKAPPALLVVSRNTKPLDAEQTEEDGYAVLRFEAPARGEISVFGGEKKGRKEWLLRYNH